MARERKFEIEKQTHFAKTHQRVMKGHYMTDVDRLQIIDTENQVYQQYTYDKKAPFVRRFIEVKSRKSQRIIDSLNGDRVEPQHQAQAIMVAELNGFRKAQVPPTPLCEYLIVIEDFNDFPYEIWKCDATYATGELTFEFQGKVYDDKEFQARFNTSRT